MKARGVQLSRQKKPSFDCITDGPFNNKHPLIPLSTLQAGHRLLLPGLAAESLHATLVEIKRRALQPALATN